MFAPAVFIILLAISSVSSANLVQLPVTSKEPSIMETTYRLQNIKKSIPMLGNLPKPVLVKAVSLYRTGEIGKLTVLLTSISKLDQLYRQQKCRAIFSRDLCNNSSAQPFFMWAKISANKMTQSRPFPQNLLRSKF